MATATKAPTTYEAIAYREGRWWTFEIPALTAESPRGPEHPIIAMGQAHSLGDLDTAAREVVALWLDTDEDAVSVTVTVRLPEDVEALWTKSSTREEEGRAAVKEAAQLKRAAVQALTAQGITQRVAARLLGVSPSLSSRTKTTGEDSARTALPQSRSPPDEQLTRNPHDRQRPRASV